MYYSFLSTQTLDTMVEIEEVHDDEPKAPNTTNEKSNDEKSNAEKYNDLMNKMSQQKEKWDEEDKGIGQDERDELLSQAIDMALEQGRGWSPGEKEAYLEKILDDDFIPPMFATTQEDMERSGLQEAFTSLIYDGESPTSLMLQFKKKASDAFTNGRRNEVGNQQYFRDAINHYYEALAWAEKIEPLEEGDLAQADTDDPTYNAEELKVQQSIICSNIALMHIQLKNWGYARDESKKAVDLDKNNVKAWFRLAKSYEMLKNWEEAGDAIEAGLSVKGEENNKDLRKLQKRLEDKIRKARKLRQQRERARAERVANVKAVWKHCKDLEVKLGRTSLVASITDDAEDEEDEEESRWHQHLPVSGVLPKLSGGDWTWPCMFLYPSHKHSDFVKDFAEDEMIAMRMAQIFPELEDYEGNETPMPWDVNNEFVCSNLAVYFEVHDEDEKGDGVVHPDSIELLKDQGSCMRFYESSRALKGDEGPEMANLIRALERKHLALQRKRWKKKHGSLWAKPDPCSVVRVHPAVKLIDVLKDPRCVVPNFIATFIMFPEKHPAHAAFLKEHKCLGILQP